MSVRAPPATIWTAVTREQPVGRFWAFIGILVLFTLGNSSDAFLMLRAQTLA